MCWHVCVRVCVCAFILYVCHNFYKLSNYSILLFSFTLSTIQRTMYVIIGPFLYNICIAVTIMTPMCYNIKIQLIRVILINIIVQYAIKYIIISRCCGKNTLFIGSLFINIAHSRLELSMGMILAFYYQE